MPTNPELCPVLALLAVSPHPLTPGDVALVLREEEGVVRLALALLHESGHAARRLERVDGRVVSKWSLKATQGNCREATGAFYRIMRSKRIDELASMTVPPPSSKPLENFGDQKGTGGSTLDASS